MPSDREYESISGKMFGFKSELDKRVDKTLLNAWDKNNPTPDEVNRLPWARLALRAAIAEIGGSKTAEEYQRAVKLATTREEVQGIRRKYDLVHGLMLIEEAFLLPADISPAISPALFSQEAA